MLKTKIRQKQHVIASLFIFGPFNHEGDQILLPQNKTSWHKGYFELKTIEMADSGEALWPHLFCLKFVFVKVT